jgi:hypothetical protein
MIPSIPVVSAIRKSVVLTRMALTRTGDDREKSYDKTLADSFPTSDPPSSIPDPSDRPLKPSPETSHKELAAGLKEGTWAALSIEDPNLVGTGTTQDEAAANAQQRRHGQIQLIRVPAA